MRSQLLRSFEMPAQEGWRHAAGMVLSQARQAWRDRRSARATIKALSRLDDRTLKDIGLDRSEIASVARGLEGCRQRQAGAARR